MSQLVPASPPHNSIIVNGQPTPVVQELLNLLLHTAFSAFGVVCGPFKSKISAPCSFIVFLHVFFVGFQSQVLYGIVFLLQDLEVGVPGVELHMEFSGPSNCGFLPR